MEAESVVSRSWAGCRARDEGEDANTVAVGVLRGALELAKPSIRVWYDWGILKGSRRRSAKGSGSTGRIWPRMVDKDEEERILSVACTHPAYVCSWRYKEDAGVTNIAPHTLIGGPPPLAFTCHSQSLQMVPKRPKDFWKGAKP